jgi:hypothetical protein
MLYDAQGIKDCSVARFLLQNRMSKIEPLEPG